MFFFLFPTELQPTEVTLRSDEDAALLSHHLVTVGETEGGMGLQKDGRDADQ